MMHICCYIITALAVIFFLSALLHLYFKKIGDADICIDNTAPQNTVYQIVMTGRDPSLHIKTQCRFVNKGKQQGLLIDCLARVHPSNFDYEDMGIGVKINNLSNPRKDGYWEAYIIKAGKFTDFEIIIECPVNPVGAYCNTPLQNKLKNLQIDVYYKYYCRNPLIYKRDIVKINLENAKEEKFELNPVVTGRDLSPQDKNITLVRTHLLTEKDNIFDIIEKYAKPSAPAGGIICIAETAMAILQGRFKYIEDINPGFWARNLNKFFDQNSSMSSAYAMQMAINQAGTAKMILAVAAGTLGKFIGRSGDFYRIAGRAVATIDDCTSTLPPYDKYVVMGPENCKEAVRQIKEKTGFDAAIVDANNLGKVDVLGISDEKYTELVISSLKKNPQGNANEQTPIVVIRGQRTEY